MAIGSWIRPAFFRRRGGWIALGLGGLAILGVPAAIYVVVVTAGKALPALGVAYLALMAGSTWAGVVAAIEPSARAAMGEGGAWGAPAASSQAAFAGAPAPLPVAGPGEVSAARVAAAAAGPAMVAAGCGGVVLVLAALAAAVAVVLGYLFYAFFLQPGSWNVG